MSMSVISVIGLGLTATSMGVTMSGALNPTQPNLAASSAELANTEAGLLPIQRALQAAAQQGTSTTVNMPAHVESAQAVQLPITYTTRKVNGITEQVPSGGGNWVPYVAADWEKGGKYNPDGTAKTPAVKTKNIKVAAGPQKFDFSGYGSADVQAKLAQAMAKVQLAMSQKYDSQFIDQALEQEKEADPQSFAARQEMNDLIQKQANRPVNEPVADTLNAQVEQELNAAQTGKLDPAMHDMLMQGAGAATDDRGGSSTPADFEAPLTTGAAGTRRQLAAIGKGTAELAGGETPEDIAYRREQQDLSNLSNFIHGQTPQSEFKSLSGAQSGPTPFNPGQPLPQLPGNIQGAALGMDQAKQAALMNQTSPWMSGLSALLGIGKTAAGLGWQPFAAGPTG